MKKITVIMLFTAFLSAQSPNTYTIQIVAAKKQSTIDIMQQKANKLGLHTSIEECKDFKRLLTGNYHNKASARKDLAKAKKVSKDAFIKPVTSITESRNVVSEDTTLAPAATKTETVSATENNLVKKTNKGNIVSNKATLNEATSEPNRQDRVIVIERGKSAVSQAPNTQLLQPTDNKCVFNYDCSIPGPVDASKLPGVEGCKNILINYDCK